MPAADASALDELVVPASLELLGSVRAWVRQRAQPCGFSDRDLGDIELAVTEAVSNVIRHAYAEDGRNQVSIQAGPAGARFVISIIDSGPPFSGQATWTDLDPPQEGGYGLRLISTVMDDATWTRRPDGRNELRLMRLCPKVQA